MVRDLRSELVLTVIYHILQYLSRISWNELKGLYISYHYDMVMRNSKAPLCERVKAIVRILITGMRNIGKILVKYISLHSAHFI